MPLHIPERKGPARITIGDAFAHLVSRTIKPDSNFDLAAAVHFAGMRVYQRGTMTAAQALSALPPLEFLDTDPVLIASAIWDGIASGKLSVEGLPDNLIDKSVARPLVSDWTTGAVFMGSDMRGPVFYYPTLDLREVNALFATPHEHGEVSSSGTETSTALENPNAQICPVALAELTAFIRSLMANERLTQPRAKQLAKQHFAPKVIRDRMWVEAWRDEPNKRNRGETLKPKSGA